MRIRIRIRMGCVCAMRVRKSGFNSIRVGGNGKPLTHYK